MQTYSFKLAQRNEIFHFGFRDTQTVNFSPTAQIQIINTDPYTGEYVVIPKAHEETILETKDKIMQDDVTVRKVPYYETSNQTGTTVYIASEVNNG